MSGTTGTVMTQSALLLEFEDGQAAGSITPQDVRNLIASIGPVAKFQEFAPVYNVGSLGAGTLTLAWANGSVVLGTLTSAGTTTFLLGATGLANNIFCAINLYVINQSGQASVAFGSNVNYEGGNPPALPPVAGIATKFRFESFDGGTSWSLLY